MTDLGRSRGGGPTVRGLLCADPERGTSLQKSRVRFFFFERGNSPEMAEFVKVRAGPTRMPAARLLAARQ